MEDVHWSVSLAVTVIPLVLFLGTVIWGARHIAKALTTWEGRSIAQIADEYGRELKRSNDLIERSLAEHRQRLDALEKSGAGDR
jgi:hypothetical protein